MYAQEISDQIVANKDKISLEAEPTADQKFCEIWPQVQAGLTMLQALIKNPIVKLVISIVFGAGNAVAAGMCNEQPPVTTT